ncbi:uncharacterized protein LOC124371154 [Homalodisca vitripennis]|uniref:uncharacterized protein LOC124371154 n=1 Tax=Homalodisca vitripennis TaxID=197043 RepID=UPI001EEA3E50|nr:uncharacterized protein LOC124371154 [Homalodisca vitripennis]
MPSCQYCNVYRAEVGLILLTLLVPLAHGMIGPCHPVTTVMDLNVKKWPGEMYYNLMTNDPGQRCSWVYRYLIHDDEHDRVLLGEEYRHIDNGTEIVENLKGMYVGKGHYIFTDKDVESSAYVHFFNLYYDPPHLDCHYICSDDPVYEDGRGTFVCKSKYPDAVKKYSRKIMKIAKQNGFDLNDLMIVDNCKCGNLPYKFGSSTCKRTTVDSFFSPYIKLPLPPPADAVNDTLSS